MSGSFSQIIKRNGQIVAFDSRKIERAIEKAGKATGEFSAKEAKKLTLKALSLAYTTLKNIPTVEEIQDIVEETLLSSIYKKTAKAYILYRDQHKQIRRVKDLFDPVITIDKYINKDDWAVKENSNMSFSVQGLNNYISKKVVSQYWLGRIYTPDIANLHTEGDMHIHDLDFLGAYCVGWDIKDLLLSGFKGAEGKVESAPAKHFRTILGQAVNFFYTLQGEAAGAQAFSDFDTYLAPFIRFDNLNYGQVKQAMQEFFFNINVPTRVGFQTPYTNITLNLRIPPHLKEEAVIYGGKLTPNTYGQFQKEVDMFNKAFFEVATEGDAKGRPFTFPIPTINILKDFDWDNPQYKYLWEATSKYGLPYFANFINSDLKPEDTRSMCCRLRLDTRELKNKGGGLFGANPLTGSIGVVTINLARIGYLSKSKQDLFTRLEYIMDKAKDSLEIKRKTIENLTQKGLFPYAQFYLRSIYKRFGQYWKNHFSTIGVVGGNEAVVNFLQKDISSREGKSLAEEILDFMRDKLISYQEETGNYYNLEATPAEGASYRLALIDKKRYPDIITQGSGGKVYYTNSTQLPVNATKDVFEALVLQDSLQTKYTGGTVLHIFLGEKAPQSGTIPKLIKTIFANFKLPYISITPTFSICPQCGYIKGKVDICPACGHKTEVYSRIVGYLRPLEQWNDGKKQEFNDRRTFKLPQESSAVSA
ncbi:MAG: ribonucleoside triphosphate reductase [Candidatus Omnitrophica bacterium]|nr:ribonucleoside triphosphate reductase [Candidatus Omnitrophota bacterium]